MFCPKCGVLNDDHAKNCVSCQAPLSDGTPTVDGSPSQEAQQSNVPPFPEKPYEPFQAQPQNPEKQPQNPPYSPYPPYQPPYTTPPTGEQQPVSYGVPNQPPYGGPPFSGTNVPLANYNRALPIIALVCSILTCNWVIGLILSIIALTRSSKYDAAVAIHNHYEANSAATLSKTLSWIAIGLSILSIVFIILGIVLFAVTGDFSTMYHYYY